jgi:serine/threonine protein kinase
MVTLKAENDPAMNLRVTQPESAPPATPTGARFVYPSGSRPLSGYTIKRGIGHGGFGEVYYALSDAGKEVALKLVRRNLEIELRGVTQCLNLKHPNLVSLFDVRQGDHDETWVVMEYVNGQCLENVLAEHPNGLPVGEVLEWMNGIAAGVAYLHDHGIVHRDLKPGNIFREEGRVKIGDYGLSKFMSCSNRSGHTGSVGTVHYMAPEVANGRYGKEIDIYGLGIMLYEMLTGHVPFEGESLGEVLMKHLTAAPDLSGIAEPYRTAIARALEKDPDKRLHSVAELMALVRGQQPSPPFDKLTAGQPSPIRGEGVNGARNAIPVARPVAPPPARPIPIAAAVPPPPPKFHSPTLWRWRNGSTGTLPLRSRREKLTDLVGGMLLSATVCLVMSLLMLLFRTASSHTHALELNQYAWLTISAVAGSWALLARESFAEGRRAEPALRRFNLLVIGLLVGAASYAIYAGLLVNLPWETGRTAAFDRGLGWTALPPGGFASDGSPMIAAFLAFFGGLMFLPRWWRQTEPTRRQRVRLWFVVATLLWAGLVNMVFQFPQPWGFMVAATISIAVQLASRHGVRPAA